MRAQESSASLLRSRTGGSIPIGGAHGVLLAATEDDARRGMVEVAANTVAQALTPLWREARGQ
jgi:hypothetical protein